MMILSQTCKAAIKGVIFLSKQNRDAKFSVNTIAEEISENPHTVAKLLQLLAKKGIINSTKGPNGGFYLTSQQALQPISQVVNVIDGDVSGCLLSKGECSAKNPCPLHFKFLEARGHIEKLLNETIIQQLHLTTENH